MGQIRYLLFPGLGITRIRFNGFNLSQYPHFAQILAPLKSGQRYEYFFNLRGQA